jgi:hypothetical protein
MITVNLSDTPYAQYLAGVIDDIDFPGYDFILSEMSANVFAVQVAYKEPDVFSGVVEDQRGRLWLIGLNQTEGQIIQTCFKAIMTSLEHRAREHFTWRKRPILQPHQDPHDLWKLCGAEREQQHGTEIPFEKK